MKPDETEILVNQVFRQVRDQLTLPQMTELNKRLVTFINRQAKLQRAAVGQKLADAEYLKFMSRKHYREIVLEVDKVTSAGIVYGTSPDNQKWKVSANLCKPATREEFKGAQMAASVRV